MTAQDGIHVEADYSILQHLIIDDTGDTASTCDHDASPVCMGIIVNASSVEIRNSLIYDYGEDGILKYGGAGGLTVANCTLFRTKKLTQGHGLHRLGGGTVTAVNVASMNNTTTTDFYGTLSNTYCMSSDNSCPSGLRGRSASENFVSTSAPVDLHLKSTANALNVGTDLSTSFTTDIDFQTRPTGASTWDIGADEYNGDDGGAAGVVPGDGLRRRGARSSGRRGRSWTTSASTSTAGCRWTGRGSG